MAVEIAGQFRTGETANADGDIHIAQVKPFLAGWCDEAEVFVLLGTGQHLASRKENDAQKEDPSACGQTGNQHAAGGDEHTDHHGFQRSHPAHGP